MWSHYTDNHKGFCVKYSLNFNDYKHSSIVKCGLFKIIYSAKISKASPRELLKVKFRANNELDDNRILTKALYKSLITKSKFWNYEKEWRLILSKDSFNIMDNGNIPFPFIEAIYLGCNMKNILKRHIVKFATSKNISIYEAKQNHEKFILDFHDLNKDVKY